MSDSPSWRLDRLNVDQAFAPFASTGVDNGPSAASTHSGPEPNLADSFQAMWSVGRFHDWKIEKEGENGNTGGALSSLEGISFVIGH